MGRRDQCDSRSGLNKERSMNKHNDPVKMMFRDWKRLPHWPQLLRPCRVCRLGAPALPPARLRAGSCVASYAPKPGFSPAPEHAGCCHASQPQPTVSARPRPCRGHDRPELATPAPAEPAGALFCSCPPQQHSGSPPLGDKLQLQQRKLQ